MSAPRKQKKKIMNITETLRGAMRRIAGVSLAAGKVEGKRRTVALPSIFNLTGRAAERHAQTHADQFAAVFGDAGGAQGDQHDQGPDRGDAVANSAASGAGAGGVPDGAERMQMLTENFEAPNPDDSFRSLAEQVLEDVIVGGFGAIEVDTTGDPRAATGVVAGGWSDDSHERGLGWAAGLGPLRAGDGDRWGRRERSC